MLQKKRLKQNSQCSAISVTTSAITTMS